MGQDVNSIQPKSSDYFHQVKAQLVEGISKTRSIGITMPSMIEAHHMEIIGQSFSESVPYLGAVTGAMQHQQRMYFWITPIQVVMINSGRFYVPAFWMVHSSH
jgi:hypothetical protein